MEGEVEGAGKVECEAEWRKERMIMIREKSKRVDKI